MFRGGDGVTPAEATQPASLAVDDARWRTELPGRGWSSPVVTGELLWMTTALDDGRDLRALAVSRETGELVHDVSVLAPASVKEIHSQNSYASPTPCVHDGRVFCHFGRYGTAAVDAATGEVLWTDTAHPIEHGGGPGSSPVVAAGRLIVTLDGADESYVMALDPTDGSELWRQPRSAPHRDNPIFHRAFATPLVTQWDGRTIVVSPGADQVNAYDPATGEELWHVRYIGFSVVPQPVRVADRVFVATGYPKPLLLGIDLDDPLRQGDSAEAAKAETLDATDRRLAVSFRGPVPNIPSPVVVLGAVWIVADKGVLTAVDPQSGERVAVDRLGGNFAASPIVYDDRESGDAATMLVASKERELITLAIRRDDDRFRVEESGRVDLEEPVYATPLPLGDRLYVRTQHALWSW